MSKHLEQIVQSLQTMTHEQLLDRIRKIRRNKYEVKPAAKAIKKKEVGSELKKLMAGMSKEEQADLFESLKEPKDGAASDT
jgi:hypothetical protein